MAVCDENDPAAKSLAQYKKGCGSARLQPLNVRLIIANALVAVLRSVLAVGVDV